jgi:hypothetical protein
MTWDEVFADRYEEWSAHMTADIGFYVDLAREPFRDDSREYVFVTRRRAGPPIPEGCRSVDGDGSQT